MQNCGFRVITEEESPSIIMQLNAPPVGPALCEASCGDVACTRVKALRLNKAAASAPLIVANISVIM